MSTIQKDSEGKTSDPVQSDVAFLYKTMIQRDPSKRRVKPVEKHLMQIHFGMSDDEEDSDYEFKPEAASDDGGGSDDIDDADDAENEPSDRESEVEEKDKTESENATPPDVEDVTVTSRRFSGMRVCCVCLTSSSNEDEIIECDSCGVLVHEGCYGTIEEDILSNHSDMSVDSTEPWFCDSCKAGIVPSCELCPNQLGIFKQTDTGRWVHLICALYVPAVAFGNTEKLTNVTLLEMPYTKWGNKACSLCEDENFSYTGVCIGCDAGMCRTYFHVTCAQKEGLLSEASIDEDIADPFYAHCKMHADKYVTKQKRRNFLTLQSHVKQFRENKETKPLSQFVKRRLEYFKKKFKETEAKRPPAWVPPHKLPRSISSSASAVRSLMRKAEMLDVASKSYNPATLVVKKTCVSPALSVEFASYYHERNDRINSLKRQTSELRQQIDNSKEHEKSVQRSIDQIRQTLTDLKKVHEDKKKAGMLLYSILQFISPKTVIPAIFANEIKGQAAAGSNDMINKPCGICNLTTDQHLLATCDQCFKSYHLGCLDPPLSRMPKKSKSCGWVCSICDHKNHQPPDAKSSSVDTEAPRMLRQTIKEPEKFVQTGVQLGVEKRKQTTLSMRGRRKLGSGFAPHRMPYKKFCTKPPGDSGNFKAEEKNTFDAGHAEAVKEDTESTHNTSTPSIHNTSANSAQNTSATSISNTSATSVSKGRKPKMLETGFCKICKVDCNGANAVRCDKCLGWLHFSCLNPPAKKSPKPRGYLWHCDPCVSVDDASKQALQQTGQKQHSDNTEKAHSDMLPEKM